METVFLILAFVWSILCLILFFKVWGMTNDVKKIVQILHQSKSDYSSPNPNTLNKEQKLGNPEEQGNIVKFKNFGGITDFKITSQNPDGTYNGIIIESGFERNNVDASLLIF